METELWSNKYVKKIYLHKLLDRPQFIKTGAQNGVRQFTTQAAKVSKSPMSLGKKIGFASLAGLTTTGLSAYAYNVIADDNDDLDLHLPIPGLFMSLKAEGYKIMAKSFLDHYKYDVKSYRGRYFMCRIAGGHAEACEILKNEILKSCSTDELVDLCKKSKEHAIILAKAAVELEISDGYELQEIAKSRVEACEVLKNEILKKCSGWDIEILCRKSKEHAIILAKAANDSKLIKENQLLVIAGSCSEACDILSSKLDHRIVPLGSSFDSERESQSSKYFQLKHVRLLLSRELSKYSDSRYDAVLSREIELNQNGYYCFYHGQMSRFGFQEDLTKDVIEELNKQGIISDKLRDDFLPIQNMKGLVIGDREQANQIYETAQAEQEDMISGRGYHKEIERMPHRLSVNIFLAGNLTEWGSCTMRFLKNNTNVFPYPLNLEKHVFEKLRVPAHIFKKYKSRFAALEQKHSHIFKSGRLLQICVPKEKVDNYVYLANIGAYKTKHKTLDGETVTTVSRFIEIATTTPERFDVKTLDRASECAIPLTLAGALDQDNGIKVFAYDADPADKKLYQKYLKEKAELVKAVAKDAAEHEEMKGKKYHLCCKAILEKFGALAGDPKFSGFAQS